MTKTNWEIANHHESGHWEKFTAEVDTLSVSQPQYMESLFIKNNYFYYQ